MDQIDERGSPGLEEPGKPAQSKGGKPDAAVFKFFKTPTGPNCQKANVTL
jgi:hypothetical protein